MNFNHVNYYEKFREEYAEYVVSSGDTLYKIAKDSGISVEELMNLNNLSSTAIYPNQILLIPSQGVSNGYYTVSGDSLNKIAKKANISVERLMKLNRYKDLLLAPNQEIKLDDERTYTISYGDTLEEIAKKYKVSVEDIINQNIDMWFSPGKTINI